MTNHDPVIQTQNLTYRYGDFTALNDVSLSVSQGEIFGFLGPNGAGKTTTIRVLMNFLYPSQGSAMLLGQDSRRGGKELHRRIGYMPSELAIWEDWSGMQYIRWLEKVHQKPLVHEAMRLAGLLDHDLSRSLRGLSTGMRRKMGLIAVLAHRPELLILDEPTTGLDPLMQQAFNHIMKEMQASGITIFLSSHNLAEVETICDRVAIIREGRVEAVETVENLTHVTFRWLELTLGTEAKPDGLSGIPGVAEVVTEGESLRIRLSGAVDMNALLKQLVRYDVRELDVKHPSLEEMFLTYYGQDEEA